MVQTEICTQRTPRRWFRPRSEPGGRRGGGSDRDLSPEDAAEVVQTEI